MSNLVWGPARGTCRNAVTRFMADKGLRHGLSIALSKACLEFELRVRQAWVHFYLFIAVHREIRT
jgi:hypothetical protein